MASFSRQPTGRGNSVRAKAPGSSSKKTQRNRARARRTNGEVQRVGTNMGADDATVAMVDKWVKSNPYLIYRIEESFFFAMKLIYNFQHGNINKDDFASCETLYGLSGDVDGDNGEDNRVAAEKMCETIVRSFNDKKSNGKQDTKNDEALARMLASEGSNQGRSGGEFIGINLMSTSTDNGRRRSGNSRENAIDLDAELARSLQQEQDNSRDFRRGHARRAQRSGRSNNRRRVRVTRNANPRYTNNRWQEAGLEWEQEDDRFQTYEQMLALDENNVKVGLKRNVSYFLSSLDKK